MANTKLNQEQKIKKRKERQTKLTEFDGFDGNQPHAKKVFIKGEKI